MASILKRLDITWSLSPIKQAGWRGARRPQIWPWCIEEIIWPIVSTIISHAKIAKESKILNIWSHGDSFWRCMHDPILNLLFYGNVICADFQCPPEMFQLSMHQRGCWDLRLFNSFFFFPFVFHCRNCLKCDILLVHCI